MPSETAVIIGGVAAGQGDQNLLLVILSGALGAFCGDNAAYLIGKRFSPSINRRAERRPKTARRLDWAGDQIRTRGGLLLITARFIPGGRTALTLSCGLTRQPHGWFARWVAVAAIIWATYAAVLGAIFGNRFKDDHTVAFLLAFGVRAVDHDHHRGRAPRPRPRQRGGAGRREPRSVALSTGMVRIP